MVCFFSNPAGPFCTHGRYSNCPVAKDRKTNVIGPFCTHGRCSVCPTATDRNSDWKCCQCSEWVCKNHCIKTVQIKCDNFKEQSN